MINIERFFDLVQPRMFRNKVSNCFCRTFFVLSIALLPFFAAASQAQPSEGWKWRLRVGGDYNALYSGERNFYVSGSERSIIAADLQTGREKWRYKLRAESWAQNIEEINGKTIVVERFKTASGAPLIANNLIGFDATTGKELWRKDFAGNSIDAASRAASIVYLNVANVGAVAINPATGGEIWRSDACPDIVGAADADDGKIYVECFGGRVYALDQNSGKLRWKSGSRGGIRDNLNFSANSFIYRHAKKYNESFLIAADKTSGREQWKVRAKDSYARQIVAGNLLIAAGVENAPLTALDLTTGKTVWQFAAPSAENPAAASPLDFTSLQHRGNAIYASSRDGNLFALDAQIGKPLWQTKISDEWLGSVQIVGDIVCAIVLQDNEYYLTAIDAASGKRRWRMRLYGNGGRIYRKNDVLFFETEDKFINAVAAPQVEKLARQQKDLGAPRAVAQIIVKRSGSGSGAGNGSGSGVFRISEDIQAEIAGAAAFATVTTKAQSRFYKIDLASGSQKLLSEFAPQQLSKPIVVKNAAYFLGNSASGHTLYAVDLTTGEILWQRAATGKASAPPLATDKYVYYITDSGDLRFFAFDGEAVAAIQTAFRNSYNQGEQAAASDDAAYFKSARRAFVRFDLSGENVRWKKTFDGDLSNIVVGENRVFVGSGDGFLHALDKETGETIWKYETEGAPVSYENSVLLDDRVVYYLSESAYKTLLQAFDQKSGKLLWERSGKPGIKFSRSRIFSFALNRVFDKATGKSTLLQNSTDFRRSNLIDVSENDVVLTKETQREKPGLQLTAFDWQNGNRILWQIAF